MYANVSIRAAGGAARDGQVLKTMLRCLRLSCTRFAANNQALVRATIKSFFADALQRLVRNSESVGPLGEGVGALVGRAKIALEEAADLCGRVTVRTHAGLHAKIALLRAHAHRRAMYKRGAASGAPVVDDAERDAAREACARGIRWAAGEDAPHDRATIRALLLELAACDVPEAMREAAEARSKEEEEDTSTI